VSEIAVLVGAMLSPLLALGLLLWLTHLEETLPLDVHAAQRKPAPPPILAVEVRAPAAAVPDPRPKPPPTLAPATLAPADLSEGGSALAV
jgi:hypothetical protein